MLIPNQDTKIILRLHKNTNIRGLDIYNPYFQETGVNAFYYLVADTDPIKLLNGVKNLNVAGAISAGFAKNKEHFDYLDLYSAMSKRIGVAEIVVNKEGKLYGHYQNGYAIVESIRSMYSVSRKTLVILGAGCVVRSLLFQLIQDNLKVSEIKIYNRTLEKAEAVKQDFPELNITYHSMDELTNAQGDIFY